MRPVVTCVRAITGALEARLGGWRMAAKLNQVPVAKAIVVVADDLEETHNVASVRVKDAVVRNGAKLVVIGALRSELVDFATAWIQPKAGEEGQAAAALAEALGGGQASGAISDAVAALKGIGVEDTVVICAPNPVHAPTAGAMAGGAANLAIALAGNAASERLLVLPPAVNSYGLLDAGISGDISGASTLLAIREDVTMRGIDTTKFETIVAIDGVLHETAKAASVVLAEGRAYASSGTYAQGDFRAQKLEPSVRPEGDAMPLFAILKALADALDVEAPASPAAALDAMAASNPIYQPAADLLVGEGVKLTIAPTGKGTAAAVAAAAVDGDGIRVIASRDLYTAEDAAALRHPEAERLHRYDRIQVSEADATRLSIRDGDEIELSSGSWTLRAPATVTERLPAGAVFVSSLMQGGAVARLFTGASLPTVKVGALTPA